MNLFSSATVIDGPSQKNWGWYDPKPLWPSSRGQILGVWESWPLKICSKGQSMLWPPKMSFIQNCCWITVSASFTSSRTNGVSKWNVKLIFRGAYMFSGTGIVECLEIIDVACNLKQFYGSTRLILTHIFYERSTPLTMDQDSAGWQVFDVAGRLTWNKLPASVRLTQDFGRFKPTKWLLKSSFLFGYGPRLREPLSELHLGVLLTYLLTYLFIYLLRCVDEISLQCFDTVSWASGRASGL